MAIVRRKLADILKHPPRIDRARIDATTEDDIRRHMIEDGEQPDTPLPEGYVWVNPRAAREKVRMTQEQFAKLIVVPVTTIRGWEQGRFTPDPAARTLLRLIFQQPAEILRALGARPGTHTPRRNRTGARHSA